MREESSAKKSGVLCTAFLRASPQFLHPQLRKAHESLWKIHPPFQLLGICRLQGIEVALTLISRC